MRFLLIPTFFVTVIGVAGVVAFHSLNKQHQFDAALFEDAMRTTNLGGLALFIGPLIVHFAACVVWRRRRPFAGFLMAVVLTVVVAWGNLVDWQEWTYTPPPQDQVTYLAAVIAAYIAWGLVAVYWAVVLVMKRPAEREMRSSGWL
jgi:hypothetical protein